MLRAELRHWAPTLPRSTVEAEARRPVNEPYPINSGWVAAFKEEGYELAPVFDTEATAYEIGRKFMAEEPFFERIPVVRYGHQIPRRPDQTAHSVQGLHRFSTQGR